jgi:hypothetical protein
MRNGPKQRRTGAFVFRAPPLDPGSVWVSPYGSNYAKVLAETLVQSGVNRDYWSIGHLSAHESAAASFAVLLIVRNGPTVLKTALEFAKERGLLHQTLDKKCAPG